MEDVYARYVIHRPYALHFDFEWRDTCIGDAIWRWRKAKALEARMHLKERKQEIV